MFSKGLEWTSIYWDERELFIIPTLIVHAHIWSYVRLAVEGDKASGTVNLCVLFTDIVLSVREYTLEKFIASFVGALLVFPIPFSLANSYSCCCTQMYSVSLHAVSGNKTQNILPGEIMRERGE